MMDKKLKEKLLATEFSQKAAERTNKFVEELFLKDTKYAADILGVQIDEDLGMAVTKTEMLQFLTLMYGILTCQIQMMEKLKATMLAQIKNENSSLAEKLSNLKLH